VSYPTLNRHLCGYAAEGFRRKLAAACAAHAKLGPASLVLYDVFILYFETDAGDGFGEPGFSKERRLEPRITPQRIRSTRRLWSRERPSTTHGLPARQPYYRRPW